MYSLQASQKKFTNTINPVLVILFFMLLVATRTTGGWSLPSLVKRTDILLPFMVYIGERRRLGEGLVLWFILSHIYSLSSTAPMGTFAIYGLIIFFSARGWSHLVNASNWVFEIIFLATLFLASRFILPLVAKMFGTSWAVFSFYNLNIGSILYNTLLGFVLCVLLAILDRVTFKAKPENIEMGEAGL